MEHARFVGAWRAGELMVEVDPVAAPAFLSARLMLPFVAIAVIGLGIALVLWGWLWTGLATGAAGIVVPRLVKRQAVHFILSNVATDPTLYADALRAGVLSVEPVHIRDAPE